MIKTSISDAELTGWAASIENDLEPVMLRAVDAGAAVLLKRVRSLLNRTLSMPGLPPAMLSGDLLGSFEAAPAAKKKRQVEARVRVWDTNKQRRGEIARQAGALEYGGTDQKGRVHPPYPFMRPAEVSARAEMEAEMMRVMEQGE